MTNNEFEHLQSGDVIAPGAFKHQAGLKVPVRVGFDGPVIGEAEIGPDGETISMELDSGAIPRELRDMFLTGMADALSIDTFKTPAVPDRDPVADMKRVLTQEEKSQRWNQNNLPYGM